MNQPPQQPRPAPPQQPGAQQPRPVPPIPAIPAQSRPAAPTVSTHGGGGAKVAGMPVMHQKADDHSLDPISLVDDYDANSDVPQTSKIKAFGVAGSHTAHTYKRQTHATGQGACRVRSFHGRLSDEGMAYMDDKINEWLDAHPDIEVKIVTTSIGSMRGRSRSRRWF